MMMKLRANDHGETRWTRRNDDGHYSLDFVQIHYSLDFVQIRYSLDFVQIHYSLEVAQMMRRGHQM
jgi:hypothetical protein